MWIKLILGVNASYINKVGRWQSVPSQILVLMPYLSKYFDLGLLDLDEFITLIKPSPGTNMNRKWISIYALFQAFNC